MKLTDRIHLLRIDFEINMSPTQKIQRFVNVILIFDESITLIDTGVKGSEKVIFDYITKQGRRIKDISTVILSHAHPDHIGSAAKIKEITNCEIIAHRDEKEWMENIELQNNLRPAPGFFKLVDQPVVLEKLIEEDSHILKLQPGLTLEILKSPGHSKGSLNIFFIEDKILFTADSVPLKNDIPNYDNYRDLIHSLQKIKNNSQYDILLTSWTPPLMNKKDIEQIINEGEMYLKKIDSIVKKYYRTGKKDTMNKCKQVIEELGLPAFFINPIVNKAFKSHIR